MLKYISFGVSKNGKIHQSLIGATIEIVRRKKKVTYHPYVRMTSPSRIFSQAVFAIDSGASSTLRQKRSIVSQRISFASESEIPLSKDVI